MKLSSILARVVHLWPAGEKFITQDSDGKILAHPLEPYLARDSFWMNDLDVALVMGYAAITAEDWSTAVIAKKDWVLATHSLSASSDTALMYQALQQAQIK